MPPIRAAIVAEFYPRAYDPVLGVWAHRQALATRDAGAEVAVFVLHRLVPPTAAFTRRELGRRLRQPTLQLRDGLNVHYVRYVSPPRGRSYASWGAWAAPALRRALHRAGPFDLIHAHNAIPTADAVRRAHQAGPLVVSVHGGDVLWTGRDKVPRGRSAVTRALAAADLVLANSDGIATLAHEFGAHRTEVVHLGTDVPAAPPQRSAQPLLVTVGHLVARKRHADVIHALTKLKDVRYLVIGDGPERSALARLSAELGVADRVELAGQLDPATALRRSREAWLFVMPSTEEAFGVAYVEAMAAGVPAIGSAGEPGPAEIAASGGGLELVPPRDPTALAATIAALLAEPDRLTTLGAQARETVARHFTWPQCGERTVAAYREALET